MLNDPPIYEDISMTFGADLLVTLESAPGDSIPFGSTIRLDVYPPQRRDTLVTIASVVGVITGNKIEFRMESEDSDELPDLAHYRIYITYPDTPDLDTCWFEGSLVRS